MVKIKIICDTCGCSHDLKIKKLYYTDENGDLQEMNAPIINSIHLELWNCCL